MQSKKRAKPVKFGEKNKKVEKPKEELKHKPATEAEYEKHEVKTDTEEQADKSPEQVSETEETEPELTQDADKFSSAPTDAYEKKKSMLLYFIMIVVITFILGLAFFAGIYYAVTNKSKILPTIKQPRVEITKVPDTVVPTKEPIDLSQYRIQVLNGTGTAGVAAKAKEQLIENGFKVGSIGNAKSDDFEKTEIAAAKKVNKEYLDKLKEILSKTYILGKVTQLASGSSDVVITIGSASAK